MFRCDLLKNPSRNKASKNTEAGNVGTENAVEKKRTRSTPCDSRVVPHPSTKQAHWGLASQFGTGCGALPKVWSNTLLRQTADHHILSQLWEPAPRTSTLCMPFSRGCKHASARLLATILLTFPCYTGRLQDAFRTSAGCLQDVCRTSDGCLEDVWRDVCPKDEIHGEKKSWE